MSENNVHTQTRLIINYLPQHLSDNALHDIFAQIGMVESCKIMREFKTGYSYGFGFVTYISPQDARIAIQKLNGFEIAHKRIKVSYARPPGEQIKDTNLYITNLPCHITENDLEDVFGKYGTIVQKNLLVNKGTGTSRGVAFVRFNTKEEAQQATAALDGQSLPGGGQPICIKVAEEHGKQKALYYAGMSAANMRMPQHRFPNNMGARGRIHNAGASIRNNFPGPNYFNCYDY